MTHAAHTPDADDREVTPAATSEPPRLATDPYAAWQRVLLAAVALIALVTVAYWPTLSAEFVRLDDFQYVVDNPRVAQPDAAGAWAFFTEVRHPATVAGYYQPLTMLSLMLDAKLCGAGELSPFQFHLTNVVLHAICCVLVMLILRRLSGGLAVPLCIAALFAVHPVQAESVAWISQRKTMLATAFAAASVLCYLASLRIGAGTKASPAGMAGTSPEKKRFPWGLLIAAWAFYVLGTLAKPTVLMLPIVLALMHALPGAGGGFRSLRRLWPFGVWMCVTAWIAWTSQAESAATLAAPSFAAKGVLARWVALLCHTFTFYLRNLVWPSGLSPYQPLPTDLSWGRPEILTALAVTLILALAWLTSWRWSRSFFVGLGGFVVILSPALGGVRFAESIVSDRFLYLPMVFLLWPAAVGLQRLVAAASREDTKGESPVPNRWPIVIAVGLVAVLGVRLQDQLAVWHDSFALWTRAHEAVPALAKANHELCVINLQREDYPAALEHGRQAVETEPTNSQFLLAFGRVMVRTGQAKEAIPIIRQAVETGLGPMQGWGHLALAEAYVANGDRQAAEASARHSLENGLPPAKVYQRLGDAAFQIAGDYTAAAEYYARVLAARPDADLARWNRGTVLAASGRDAEALAEYERVIANYVRQGNDTRDLERAADALRHKLLQSQRPAQSPTPTPEVQP